MQRLTRRVLVVRMNRRRGRFRANFSQNFNDFRPHRMHRVHAAYCYRSRTLRHLCVGASVGPAKTVESMEMPFRADSLTQGNMY